MLLYYCYFDVFVEANSPKCYDETMKISDILGWIGTISLLLGYALLTMGIINNDLRYFLLTLFGSVGIAYISYIKRAWQPFVLNLIFGILSVIAILRLLL